MNKPSHMMALQKEIEWFNLDRKDIEAIIAELSVDKPLTHAMVKLPLDIQFTISTNNSNELAYLSRIFSTQSIICPGEKRATQLENVPKHIVLRYDIHPKEDIPYIGLIDENSPFGLLLGESSGLLKSLVVGFASSIASHKGYHPAHASICQINGLGIMMSGGHMAGKTTSLTNLLYLAEGQKAVLTDDWTLVSNQDHSAISLEKTISFTRRFAKEFEFLDLSRHFNPTDPEKKFLLPEELYGAGTRIESANIDIVFILEPINREELLSRVDTSYAARRIVDNADHMPICSARDYQNHVNFWVDFLERISVYSFDTRNKIGVKKSYEILYKFITKNVNKV